MLTHHYSEVDFYLALHVRGDNNSHINFDLSAAAILAYCSSRGYLKLLFDTTAVRDYSNYEFWIPVTQKVVKMWNGRLTAALILADPTTRDALNRYAAIYDADIRGFSSQSDAIPWLARAPLPLYR